RSTLCAPLPAGRSALAFGGADLVSYAFDVARLLPLPQFALPTRPSAAVLFLLAGASLLALRVGVVPVQRYAALLAALLAAAVVAEYAVGVDLGLDRLLFPQAILGTSRIFPGRPAPITAATFLLLGIALLVAAFRPDERLGRAHIAIVIAAIALPIIPIVGHLTGVPELHSFALRLGTALHTAAALLLLALGVAAATHEPAIRALVRVRDPGTTLLRLLLPL